MRHSPWSKAAGALLIGAVLGLLLTVFEAKSGGPAGGSDLDDLDAIVTSHSIWKELTAEEIITGSDKIFVGTVERISKTYWNQDSGASWQEGDASTIGALQVHDVRVRVAQIFWPPLPPNVTVVDPTFVDITQLGVSPAEPGSEYSLQLGQTAVFYLKNLDIAWRETGTRGVLSFTAFPEDALQFVGPAGTLSTTIPDQAQTLVELEAKVAALKGTGIQP